MIRAMDPPPPENPQPPSEPGDVGDIRIALFRENSKQWDLVLVVTPERLRQIMRPGFVMTCLVDEVPGFGPVPPVCLVFMSAITRSKMTPEQIIMEAQMDAVDDFLGLLPVIFTLSHAADLRKHKVLVLTSNARSMKEQSVPAWERMQNVIFLLADTHTQVSRLLERFSRKPGVEIVQTDDEDRSMW